MHIVKVQDKYSQREFYQFPTRLYRNYRQWVPLKLQEVDQFFETERDGFPKENEVCRWILQNYRGATIGRIAAFVDRQEENTTGYLGLFECIEHEKAAEKLLEEGSHWLQRQGVAIVNAPVNPNSLLLKAGLLTQGFDSSPGYTSNYHPNYYQEYFESCGFVKHLRQQTLRFKVDDLKLPRSVQQKAQNVLYNRDFKLITFKKDKLDQMARDIANVYNAAWQSSPVFYPLTEPQIKDELHELLPWIDEDVFLLAYHQQQAVGFFFNLPDLNQARRLARNGIFKKVREAYFRKVKHKHLLSVLLGVLPEFQNRGVGSALIKAVVDHLKSSKANYTNIETNRIGDDLEVVRKVVKQFLGKVHQQYWIYDKQLPVINKEPAILANQSSDEK
ncbi:MAG: GNAT family N-acetyltransferase [Bacteroidota bacterium]